MNKTKEEIKKHLEKVGYESTVQYMIMAYLYGKDIIALDEDIPMVQNGDKVFLDFIDWIEDKKQEDDADLAIWTGLFEDICQRAEESDSLVEIDKYIKQMDVVAKVCGYDIQVSDE